MSYGQVNIKERVEINPSDKNVLRSVNEDYPPILISVNSPSQTNTIVGDPLDGRTEGSGEPGEVVVLEVPAANGTYHVTVYVFIGAGGTSIASYWADWNGQSIGNGSHYVSNAGGESDDYVPTTFSFTFGSIPELNDFSIFFSEDEVCGTSSTRLSATTSGIETGGISLNISLEGDNIGAVIYDNSTHTSLGTSTTTTFANVRNLSVLIDSLYVEDEDKTVVVTGEAEGMTRTDELTVKSAKQYADFIIRPYPDEPTELYTGMSSWVYANTYRGGGCGISWEDLPEDIKYNFAITKGTPHGYLAHRPDGYKISERGTEIYDVENSYGSGYVIYQSYASTTLSTDTVIVNISTTDPDVEPVDVELYLSPNPIYSYAEPDPVAIGDTSQIVIKHFTSSGEIEDFPEDQLFYVEIYEGYDYGTLYSSSAGYTDSYFEDVPGNFSFIAADEIDADSVSALIWVWVYLEDEGGGISSQNLSVKGNNLSRSESFDKIRNELIEKRRLKDRLRERRDNSSLKQLNKGSAVMAGGEWYYTEFEIIVKEKLGEELYVKADFTKEKLYPGDTVSVSVKKVDEDGDEYDFPAGTNFEVGLKDGCDAGYILDTAGVHPAYIESMQEPIRIVINESLTEADTLISLRVGVPSVGDTIYKPYEEFLSKQLNIAEGENTKPIKQDSREVTSDSYCCNHSFLHPGFGMASAGIVSLQIISPVKDTTFTITVDQEMPEIICKAKLINYEQGAVKFKWEFGVYYEFKRKSGGYPVCSRTGAIVCKGESDADNSETTEWEVPFDKEEISYILLKAKDFRGAGCEEEIKSWEEGDAVFIGGDVYISVLAFDEDDQFLDIDDIDTISIIGARPTFDEIKEYEDDIEILALMEQESYYYQFADIFWKEKYKERGIPYKKGMPLYGPPNGFGLMQLDFPAATELQLWHWKKNIDAGKELFTYTSVPDAVKYIKKQMGDKYAYTNEEKLKEAWYLYNGGLYGGHYWIKYESDDGEDVLVKNPTRRPHSDLCWDRYQRLKEN
ncbi:hypothetical protein ACFLTH_08380 [Bacteroidota bacterium]